MMTEQTLTQLEQEIPKIANRAFRDARSKALASGCSVHESVNGEIIETSPSGTTRVIKMVRTGIAVDRSLPITIRKV